MNGAGVLGVVFGGVVTIYLSGARGVPQWRLRSCMILFADEGDEDDEALHEPLSVLFARSLCRLRVKEKDVGGPVDVWLVN